MTKLRLLVVCALVCWSSTASAQFTATPVNMTQLLGSTPSASNPVPVNVALGGNAVSTTNPIPVILCGLAGVCNEDFPTRWEFDLNTTGTTDLVPGYALAIEGGSGPQAVGGSVGLPITPVSGATFTVLGSIADGSSDSGAPVKVGAYGTTSIVGMTPLSNGQRANLVTGADRLLLTRPFANLEDRVSAVVGVTDGSSTSLVAAQGSGVRFCATNFIVSNSSATNVTVDIRDGTGGSVLATIPAAANMGGASVTLQVPICTTANTAMAMDPSASATTVTVTAVGFKTEL